MFLQKAEFFIELSFVLPKNNCSELMEIDKKLAIETCSRVSHKLTILEAESWDVSMQKETQKDSNFLWKKNIKKHDKKEKSECNYFCVRAHRSKEVNQ